MADVAALIDDVRLLTSDTDPASKVFDDPEYARFLSLRGNDPRLAAATALRAMAGNIAQVRGKLRMLDLTLDGADQAKALYELADAYEREVDEVGVIEIAKPGGR